MKLTIVLVVVLGYSTLLLTKAAQQPTSQPAQPTATPTPTATPQSTPTCPCQCPTPATTQTPAATVSPTQTATATPSPAITASPTTTSSPMTTASPTTTASPATIATPNTQPSPASTTPPVAGAKAACEDKVQASGIPLCSRVQPQHVVLGKDAVQPSGNPVKSEDFTHEAHATLKYSADGTKLIGCAECHHTDQPASALTGVLKTSYRGVMLTSAVLTMPAEKPVFSCRACHAQEGKKPDICDATLGGGATYAFCPNIPKVKYPDDDDETILTNAEAYHRNCINCHTDAVTARRKPGAVPFIKGAPPTTCTGCHKGA